MRSGVGRTYASCTLVPAWPTLCRRSSQPAALLADSGDTMNVAPQPLTFSRLVTGRLFPIPDYQRAYSWTSKQRKDLFWDIER